MSQPQQAPEWIPPAPPGNSKEVSRISGPAECASSILLTAREDQKLGQWDDFARHASPQSQIEFHLQVQILPGVYHEPQKFDQRTQGQAYLSG